MEQGTAENERFFSVDLKSKADLKNINLTNSSYESVLVEGTIGELVQAAFMEGVILEVVGKRGTLRINLKANELLMPKKELLEVK
jgi:hypothetical protein